MRINLGQFTQNIQESIWYTVNTIDVLDGMMVFTSITSRKIRPYNKYSLYNW